MKKIKIKIVNIIKIIIINNIKIKNLVLNIKLKLTTIYVDIIVFVDTDGIPQIFDAMYNGRALAGWCANIDLAIIGVN